MKLLNTHGKFCIANEINLLSIYEMNAVFARRKYEKNSRLSRKFSERERYLGNANYDYIPDPSVAVPRVIDAYVAASKPGVNANYEYIGDKFPRVYWKENFEPLQSLATESFAELTLINVTRSPLEVINSICRRIKNSKLGLDSWRAIESCEAAISEWKVAWNARKSLYSKIPFQKVIDLNYNSLVFDPESASAQIASVLGVDNSFDHSIVSDAPIEWHLDQSQMVKINSSLPSVLLCNNWQKFGLFLDRQTLVFK